MAKKPETAVPAGRVVSVTSRPEAGFNRAGLRFSRTATIVKEEEIGADRFDQILAEPMLECRPVSD